MGGILNMKIEKINKVYSCCGQYLAPTKSVENNKIYCPRCNQLLTTPIKCPSIVIFKKS